MDRKNRVSSLFFLSAVIQQVGGFSYGGPASVCQDGLPHHSDTDPMYMPPPFKLAADRASYLPGDVITLTISSPVGKRFEGYIMRANRLKGDTVELLGNFFDIPPGAKLQKWYGTPGDMNCVTHKQKEKHQEITVKWKAPNVTAGDIKFSAGIVLHYDEFWIDVATPVIRAIQSHTPKVMEKVDMFDPPLDVSACGKTKGCLVWPKTCREATCSTVVTYSTVNGGSHVDFEMMAETDGYIAIGFSDDLYMGHDETYQCVHTPYKQSIKHGYSPHYYNHIHLPYEMTGMQLKREGNRLYCRFRRPIKTTIQDWTPTGPEPHVFDLNDPYYLQVAVGHLYNGTDTVHKHEVLPLVSVEKVDFQSAKIVTGQLMYAELQVHAFFAITAWVLLAGIVKALSAIMKKELSNTLCGLAAWFQLHRALAIIVFLFTAVSIIVIFVYLKEFAEEAFVHAVCGLVVTGMVILQLVVGLVRPDKDHKNRKLWYWLHFCWGHLTHIMAAVTLILSSQISLFDAYLQRALLIIFVVWLGVQILWDIIFFMVKLRMNRKDAPSVSKTELNKFDVEEKEKASREGPRWLRILFLLYIICLVALYIAALFYVFAH